jgi:MoxR-like ATPase
MYKYVSEHINISLPQLRDARTVPSQPSFTHHDEYVKGIDRVFSLFLAKEDVKRFLSAVLIIRNAKIFLSGGYGSGKNTFVEIAAKTFFGDDLGVVRCHQELTTFDILWNINITRTLEGKANAVTARPLIVAPFKYLNEVQRLNTQCQNALLNVLTDKTLVFGDTVAETPDYVAFLDRNPHDIGTQGMVKALLDRIDFYLDVEYLGMKHSLELLETKFKGKQVDDLRNLAEPVLNTAQMMEIWHDVENVAISDENMLKVSMISMLLRKCIRVDRSITSSRFRVICEGCPYNGQPCSKQERPVGQRWVDSAIKLGKACAWLDRKAEVTLDDLLWGISRVLPHRIDLKQNVFVKFANENEWMIEDFIPTVHSKLPMWEEAIPAFQSARTGDHTALEKLNELAEKCLAVRELRDWAQSDVKPSEHAPELLIKEELATKDLA